MDILIAILLLLTVLFLAVLVIFFFQKFLQYYETEDLLQKIGTDSSLLENIEDKNELVRIASRLEGVGQFRRAVKAWDRYLELDGPSAPAFLERGKMYYQLGDYDQALKDLRKVTGEHEPFPEVHLYLARCYREKGNIRQALKYYSDYLKEVPENLTVSFEVAQAAREGREFEEAEKIYERVRKKGVQELYSEATLELIDLAILNDNLDRAAGYLKDLYRLDNRGKLSEKTALLTRYKHAKMLEKEGDLQEALRLYQNIYRIQPEFMDVSRHISRHIEKLNADDLLKDYVRSPGPEFLEISRYIVQKLGYNIVEGRFTGDPDTEGVRIEASKKTKLWRRERVVFDFKKWNHQIGEWPLREFELNLKEAAANRGYMVVPGGFKPAAIKFTADKRHLDLIGPEKLIGYLRKYRKITIEDRG